MGDEIRLTLRDERWGGEWKEVVFDGTMDDLRRGVLNGEIEMTRQPISRLEKNLARLKECYDVAGRLKLLRQDSDGDYVNVETLKTLNDAISLIEEYSRMV